MKSNFREQSPAFDITLPDGENVFNAEGLPFAAGTHGPMVDDGIYVMLAPLSMGRHTLHFTGTFPQVPFVIDITYKLCVGSCKPK